MTLNQVVKILGDVATAHKQIKSIYFGDFADYLSKGSDVVYPSMYYDITGANIASTSLNLDFSLYFFDRMLPEDTNETEALSDMLEVAKDMVATLRYNNFEFDFNGNATFTFFTEDTPDLLVGVKVDVSLELPYNFDRCQIPTSYSYPQ